MYEVVDNIGSLGRQYNVMICKCKMCGDNSNSWVRSGSYRKTLDAYSCGRKWLF